MRSAGIVIALPLLAIPASAESEAGIPAAVTGFHFTNTTNSTASITTGSAYAEACQSSYFSYSAAYDQWSHNHKYTRHFTQVYGGNAQAVITGYKDATTLCDGHARVAHSPATPIYTKTVTKYAGKPASTSVITATYWSEFPNVAPTCTIQPSDCAGLWNQYSSSTSASPHPLITPAPTPPCANSSEAALESDAISSMYGCGPCTIYGDEVQLLYFPITTSVSRNMCATTPSAKLTRVKDDDIEVYAGKSYGHSSSPGAVTAVVGEHTFTSGTAYISIGSVYAKDRCNKDSGKTVTDVILAMPSASVLSMRYSQDHFQYFSSSTFQTGYPVSYADFQKPIPWSAWNGQAVCECPRSGCGCDVIYEDEYRPQLAIPAAITRLDPAFKTCAFFYRGLYDPPSILTPATMFETPTNTHTVAYQTVSPEKLTTVKPGSGLQMPPSTTTDHTTETTNHPATISPNFGGVTGTEHYSIVTVQPGAVQQSNFASQNSKSQPVEIQSGSSAQSVGQQPSSPSQTEPQPEVLGQTGQGQQGQDQTGQAQTDSSGQLLLPSQMPTVYKVVYATITLAPAARVTGHAIVTNTVELGGTTYTVLQEPGTTIIAGGAHTITVWSTAVSVADGIYATITSSELVLESSSRIDATQADKASETSTTTSTDEGDSSSSNSGPITTSAGTTASESNSNGQIGKTATTTSGAKQYAANAWWYLAALTAAVALYYM